MSNEKIVISLTELEAKFLEALVFGAKNMSYILPGFEDNLSPNQKAIKGTAIEIATSILEKLRTEMLQHER